MFIVPGQGQIIPHDKISVVILQQGIYFNSHARNLVHVFFHKAYSLQLFTVLCILPEGIILQPLNLVFTIKSYN